MKLFLALIPVLLGILLISANILSHGQEAKEVLPPPVPFQGYHSPLRLYHLRGGFWRTDHSFRSVLTIKNTVEIDAISVTPVLVMANGVRFPLSPVKLQPSGIASVDINEALASLKLSSTAIPSEFGTINLEYAWHWGGAIIGEVQDIDADRSLSYSSGLRPDSKENEIRDQVTEGLWWRYTGKTGGYLRLTDAAAAPIAVTLKFFGDDSSAAVVKTRVIAPGRTTLLNLAAIFDAVPGSPEQGGVRISFRRPVDGLIADGGLEDDSIGFSARLNLGQAMTPEKRDSVREERIKLSSIGMMVGRQNPALKFPSEVSFEPFLTMRNTTEAKRLVSVSVNYMSGAEPKTAHLLDEALPANASRRIEIGDAIHGLHLNPNVGYINLVYSFEGRPADVLISAGSIDDSGTYVSETPAARTIPSMARAICHWQISGGVNTMFALWNYGDLAEDMVLTFFYDGGSYKLPVHLEAKASTMLSMEEVIARQQPDADGNLIPSGATEGSATLSGSRGEVEHISVAVQAGTYNPTKATCSIHCINCSNGYIDAWINPDPFSFAAGASHQFTATGQKGSGTQYNLTASSNWSSTNAAAVTIQAAGSSSPGLARAAAAGAADIFFTFAAVDAQVCGAPPICEPQELQATDPVTVPPTISLTCTNQHLSLGLTAPAPTITGSCTATGAPAGGTYTWSASTSTISLNGSGTNASYSSSAASTSAGDTTVSVKYTVNSQSASATSSAITVHKPTSLSASAVSANGTAACTLPCLTHPGNGTCNATPGTQCTYSANQFRREYKVLDQFGTFFQDSGVGINDATVTESVSLTSNNCGGSGITTGSSALTDFFDDFGKCDTCCQQGGPGCTTNAAQTLIVNGFAVRQTTITETCTAVSIMP